MHSDDDITGNASETDTANKGGETLAKDVDEETYFAKTLSNNTARLSTISSEIYRKLIRHIQDENIRHNTYKIKQD
jgi:hypothetical protein